MTKHKVTYQAITDIAVAVRAMQGQTTRAIAREFKISESMAQYRISKAQLAFGTYFRRDYRNGTGEIVKKMLAATANLARQIVVQDIAPKFATPITYAQTKQPKRPKEISAKT